MTLEQAQIENNLKQAQFFEKKTAELEQDSRKSTWQRLFDASTLIQWIGHLVALAAVMAAFFATYSSNTELREARNDADFHEALVRMGDKDSAIVRASAAELLALKARTDRYYEPARSQLLHAFLLETDPVVLGAVQDAVAQLIEDHDADLRPRLTVITEKLNVQVVESLARVSLDQRGQASDDISDERWLEIEALVPQTGLTRKEFAELIKQREKTFLAGQLSASIELANMSDEERRAARAKAESEFKTAALRLRLSNKLLEAK